MWRIVVLWGPVAAFMLLLFTASSHPVPPQIDLVGDKLLHAGAYGLLGLLAARAFHGGFRRFEWKPTLGALILTVGYGALDELHQSVVPGRHPSALDLLADTVGAVLAILLTAWIQRWKAGRPPG